MTPICLQRLWDAYNFLALPLGFMLLYSGLFTFLWLQKALRFDCVQVLVVSLVSAMIVVLGILSYFGSHL